MIFALAQSVLIESLAFLRTQKDFFTKTTEEKAKLLPESIVAFPSIASYFQRVSEQELMEDLENFLSLLTGKTSQEIKKGGFTDAFIHALMKDFAFMVDTYPQASTQHISSCTAEILSLYSTQEISEQIYGFIASHTKIPFIIVQSPIELSAAMKQEIRTSLLEKYTYAFPTFALNKELIGGIRILVDGITTDQSWFGRVMNLSHLLYQRT